MDFKTATDRLTACISHVEIADAAGVSVQSIRQARLDQNNPNHRPPPDAWEKTVIRLAREKRRELKVLIEELQRSSA
jgi:hypothetical protein